MTLQTPSRCLTRLAAALVGAAVALGGCGGDPSGPDESTPLIPLAVGTRWTYAYADSVEVGAPFAPSTLQQTLTVSRDTVIGGASWAILTSTTPFVDFGATTPLLGSRADGIYELSTSAFGVIPSVVTMKFPSRAVKGTRYGFNGDWVVANADTTIRVPAGTYQAIRYDRRASNGTDQDSYFIARGIGIIARVTPAATLTQGGTVLRRTRGVLRLVSVSIPTR